MKARTAPAASHGTPIQPRAALSWRALAAGVVSISLAIGLLALIFPGTARLVVLQPARDLAFFQRELEPLRYFADIEPESPSPTTTIVLKAANIEDIDLVLDVWLPDARPAPVALLLHGSSPRGRLLGFNQLVAERLRQAGWLVLTPDARGFGDSGTPANSQEPSVWSVAGDLDRLLDYARSHPDGNGTVAAIGHSLGASQLMQLDLTEVGLAGLALIGPSRHAPDDVPSWGERVRFSSDRRFARVLPEEVVLQDFRRHDLPLFAARYRSAAAAPPLLLMDGAREGDLLVDVLTTTAEQSGTSAVHVTVADSHHYCGAYQLPWPLQTVYVRPAVFDRCVEALTVFLNRAVLGG